MKDFYVFPEKPLAPSDLEKEVMMDDFNISLNC